MVIEPEVPLFEGIDEAGTMQRREIAIADDKQVGSVFADGVLQSKNRSRNRGFAQGQKQVDVGLKLAILVGIVAAEVGVDDLNGRKLVACQRFEFP